MDLWKLWKQGFDIWENNTAAYIEEVLKSPLVLGPSGKLLSKGMKLKAKVNDKLTSMWGSFGLPTKRDQERSLHALNQIQSRLIDLEERLEDLNRKPA
jgi:hypothetical protein